MAITPLKISIFEPFKDIDFQRSYITFSDTGVESFGTFSIVVFNTLVTCMNVWTSRLGCQMQESVSWRESLIGALQKHFGQIFLNFFERFHSFIWLFSLKKSRNLKYQKNCVDFFFLNWDNFVETAGILGNWHTPPPPSPPHLWEDSLFKCRCSFHETRAPTKFNPPKLRQKRDPVHCGSLPVCMHV